MATIYLGDDGSGADFTSFNFSFLNEYTSYAYSFSGVSAYSDDNNRTYFQGDKLIYRGTGGEILLDPTAQGKDISAIVGGTIKGVVITQNGVNIVSVSGLKVSAEALYKAVTSNDNEAIKNILLSGDDVINGTRYADILEGRAGKDTLDGNGGRDTLKGGAGDDVLFGGAAGDKLHGQSGNDTFVYNSLKDSYGTSNSTRDTIYDFTRSDKIDFSAIDANSKTTADESFSFLGTKAFTRKAGELRYEKKASDTYIYADVNGDKKADFSIHLDDAVSLQKGYFVL
ncbi:Ca2+-binding RTX toxin-like protein [Pararhizobium capsulatum DSM 1112]|uniref:Ca2+-binding RTX toxin-like protein n=1 Tax=Pararhizobium capsulatum DSM 1112 TaxID=1121113 RepID=A0ABU0BV69_9HYPH|nr:M10 family metallopeptidase C-terminal domain-containing protein [Pararhizobium capsulatum]MDQ0322139.1 Ca2+-binding RTX toxin-like protein [Pararhizobium capsulatum DSM 1112]